MIRIRKKNYFPKSIDLEKKCNNPFLYFSSIKHQLYFIKKDTSLGKTKFEISNFRLDTNSFIISSLFQFETADTILSELGVEFKNGLVNYKESQLISIFNSELAKDEIIARRIKGFPLLTEELSLTSIMNLYWYYVVSGILLLVVLVRLLTLKN